MLGRILATMCTGAAILVMILYLSGVKLFNVAFHETDIPAEQIVLLSSNFEFTPGATANDQTVTARSTFRNNSELKLIDLDVTYTLYDCPSNTISPACRKLHEINQGSQAETPGGFRGTVVAQYSIQGMPTPRGSLILAALPYNATGVRE